MAVLPTLEDQVIAALRRITRAIDLHSRLLMQEYGLTAPQLATLQAIVRLEPVTIGAIGKAIHLSQATVTGIVGRLEKRGLATRARSERDRRSVVVELTDAGRALAEGAPSLLQDRFRQELAKLQEWERTMMLATLQRIASMMDAEAIEAAPVLVPGVVGAVEEDVSRYLQKAAPSDRAHLAEEPPASARRPGAEEPGSRRLR